MVVFLCGRLIEWVNTTHSEKLKTINNPLDIKVKQKIKEDLKKQKKRILTAGLLTIFSTLALVKYVNFFSGNINRLFDFFNFSYHLPFLNFLLPLGISFYTFQSAGYLIDVYRGKSQADKNIAKFALFVSFFPQLVQGPISRHSQLACQLYQSHEFDYQRVKFGFQLMIWGLFKKLVIADRAAILVNNVFSNYGNFEGLIVLITVMFYGVQIYADFSGGIDVARGVAQIFGIDLTPNFARPFFATSLSDFWRRWHITLGAWVRDYVFYPLTLSKSFTKLGRFARKQLGSNFGKMVPTLFAMILIFLIIGIWHGPQWKYVFYGLYNGIIISFGIMVAPILTKVKNKHYIRTETFSWRFFQISGTFLMVTIGRYFTRSADFMTAIGWMKQTFITFNPWIFFDGTLYNLGLDRSNFHLLLVLIVLLLGVDLFQELGYQIREKISQQNIIFRWAVYLVAIFSIIIFGIYGIGYDAANFIYMGF